MEKYEENVTEIMHTLNEVDGKTNKGSEYGRRGT